MTLEFISPLEQNNGQSNVLFFMPLTELVLASPILDYQEGNFFESQEACRGVST